MPPSKTLDNLTINSGTIDANSNDIEDGGTTIYDGTGGHIEQSILENDSLTVTAGDGLKNGGSVSLGSSISLDIEPTDFAGNALVDDGSNNLAVSSNSIQTDELDLSISPSWTGQHDFGDKVTISGASSGTALEVSGGDILAGGNKIQEIGGTPDASGGQIRMANPGEIRARNSGDSGDLGLIKGDSSDKVVVASTSNVSEIQLFGADTNLSGNSLTKVGGTTDVSSGAIRMGGGSGASAGILWADQGGGTPPGIYIDSNGEVIARDDDGNTTQLT